MNYLLRIATFLMEVAEHLEAEMFSEADKVRLANQCRNYSTVALSLHELMADPTAIERVRSFSRQYSPTVNSPKPGKQRHTKATNAPVVVQPIEPITTAPTWPDEIAPTWPAE